MSGTSSVLRVPVDYGPATPAVRRLIAEWRAIRWFAPPDPGAAARAIELIGEHNALARAHAPESFPPALSVQLSEGSWSDFIALCDRVREPQPWDWKYGALKRLSAEHSRRWGLELSTRLTFVEARELGDDDLMLMFGGGVVWNMGPVAVGLAEDTAPERRTAAGWYASYAQMDIIAAVEWQIAASTVDLAGDPFVPLVRCYAARLYPFSLAADRLLLFAFRE